MTTEAERKKHKKYIEKLKQSGIRQHLFRCTDEQYLLLKGFFKIIRKIENLENLVALDVSDNERDFKLVFREEKND